MWAVWCCVIPVYFCTHLCEHLSFTPQFASPWLFGQYGVRDKNSALLFHCCIAQCLPTPQHRHKHIHDPHRHDVLSETFAQLCTGAAPFRSQSPVPVLPCCQQRALCLTGRFLLHEGACECTCCVQDTLLAFGQLVVSEQENVRRVQLANEYLNSAALAGADGSSMPEGAR
jgi:hypothetical protein